MKKDFFKNLTDEELVEAYVFPNDLSPEEKKAADEELKQLRMKALEEMPAEKRIFGELLGLKFRMLEYLKEKRYEAQYSFGSYLNEYLEILGKTAQQLAEEINLQPEVLKKILLDKSEPETSIVFRLEKHSGQTIPALLWWKLLSKKWEYNIQKDQETRKKEGKHVKNELRFQSNAA